MSAEVTLAPAPGKEDPSRLEAISFTVDGKTKWLVPKQHFCEVPLTLKQFEKLEKWQKKGHSIAVSVRPNGELLLTNETMHAKWFRRKH